MYQTGRSRRSRARLNLTAFCTLSRSFSSPIAVASARASSRPPASARAAGRAGSSSASGSGPGANRTPGNAEPLGDLAGLVAELERPDRVGRVHVHRAVLRDPRRPGVPGDRLPDRRRPALEQLGHAGLRAEAGELAADLSTERFQVPPPRPAPAPVGSADACVAVIIACPIPEIRSASTCRRPRSSSESTSSRRRSGGSGSSSASARSSESTARRCSPCEPNWRRSRSPLAIEDVVEVRPEPGRAAVDVLRKTRFEHFERRRLGVVAEPRGRQAELVRARGERGRQRLERRRGASSTSVAPSAATRSVHGSSAARSDRCACTRRSAAFRCASAARYSCGAPARAGKTRPSTRSK